MGRPKYELKPQRRDPSYKRVFGNYPAKKYKKGTPVEARLKFEFTGTGDHTIDIAAALSVLNRKLFRQGCYYYVNSVELHDNATNVVDLYTASDTWVTRSAHRRGKAIWDEMNARAMSQVGNIAPKYHDFKVYLDTAHFQEVGAAGGPVTPKVYNETGAVQNLTIDDWVYSEFVSAKRVEDGATDAQNMVARLMGAHSATQVGLIKSYADTRIRGENTSPNVDGNLPTDPLFMLFDDGFENDFEEIIGNLDADNDATPYDNDSYIGESTQLSHKLRLTTTPEAGRVTFGHGFCAPLGLVRVCTNSTSGSNTYSIVLNLALGTYHGIYAEKI